MTLINHVSVHLLLQQVEMADKLVLSHSFSFLKETMNLLLSFSHELTSFIIPQKYFKMKDLLCNFPVLRG